LLCVRRACDVISRANAVRAVEGEWIKLDGFLRLWVIEIDQLKHAISGLATYAMDVFGGDMSEIQQRAARGTVR